MWRRKLQLLKYRHFGFTTGSGTSAGHGRPSGACKAKSATITEISGRISLLLIMPWDRVRPRTSIETDLTQGLVEEESEDRFDPKRDEDRIKPGPGEHWTTGIDKIRGMKSSSKSLYTVILPFGQIQMREKLRIIKYLDVLPAPSNPRVSLPSSFQVNQLPAASWGLWPSGCKVAGGVGHRRDEVSRYDGVGSQVVEEEKGRPGGCCLTSPA